MTNYYDYGYGYNQYMYPYQNPYETPRPQGTHHFHTQDDIQSHLNAGRKGHCFKGFWGGREHTFLLIGLRVDGTVEIIENGQPGTVHRVDIQGLSYQGIQCPAPQPPPGGGGSGGGTLPPPGGGGSWPPHCHWVQTPWGWQKVCH
ncbi:MAG: hypothetical protein M3Z48_01805 [Lactobacillus sp.]|uniref:Uncharacterized protein n=1 Tax=Bacillus cereus (strain G9842) TaxID=405531 RepID=B7IKI4_BACC2|nr:MULTISPECIES: hypothetical protein [Bacillus cereus group]ACK97630.1 hypothetical protein BCG9842_B2388 [Bacillus cereus G9842]MCT6901946.1 hypothetical protein [Lactobacillus sp.]PER85604.1 hypothetical protein CN498_20610 [Bacillus thuringiensis]PGS26360.1 hypothetical protein COC65_26980 [Bacillus thuringiensis]